MIQMFKILDKTLLCKHLLVMSHNLYEMFKHFDIKITGIIVSNLSILVRKCSYHKVNIFANNQIFEFFWFL